MDLNKQALSDEIVKDVTGGYMTGYCTDTDFVSWLQSEGFQVNYGDENTPGYIYIVSGTTGLRVVTDDDLKYMYDDYQHGHCR